MSHRGELDSFLNQRLKINATFIDFENKTKKLKKRKKKKQNTRNISIVIDVCIST